AEACATEMAGPLAAAIPASALAATATPILSFRSEQVMRIAASMHVFRCHPDGCSAGQPEFAAARRRLGPLETRLALARLGQSLHANVEYLKSPKRRSTRISCALPYSDPDLERFSIEQKSTRDSRCAKFVILGVSV